MMDWTKPESQDGAIKVPPNWLFIHYYEALTILFRIENALRTLVYIVLKTEFGDDWVDLSISSDDEGDTTVAALSKKRSAQDDAFGYLGFRSNSHLMYLTSGELVRIITSDAYWPKFTGYFLAAKNVVVLKLQEIGNVRNSLAHFRPIRPDDVEVVKQNANQVLSLIEATLVEIINCSQRVPSNSQEEWFKELSTLGTELITVTFHQSQDGAWIRLKLTYACPVLSVRPTSPSDFVSYEVLNVVSPEILRQHGGIRESIIFMTEETPFMGFEDSHEVSFRKEIDFTFSRGSIEGNHATVKPLLEKVLNQVMGETEQIREDNLARGAFVTTTQVSGRKKSLENRDYWEFAVDRMRIEPGAADPPEYWGELASWNRHFVSDTQHYPWMPTSISFFKVT